MIIDFTYKPMPIHAAFHQNTSYERMLFGAFGSGKSYAIIAEAIAWCLEQPGIEGAIVRKTVPELKRTTEPVFMKILPPELWHAGHKSRSGGHLESFTFPNGSKLWFFSMDDWNKHRSWNGGFLAYDEANEIDEESYIGMTSRVRQSDITAEAIMKGYTHKITRRGIWGATNPAGKDWLYRRFHPDSKDRQQDSEIFTSTTLDNPFLPPEYVQNLLTMPRPWIQRYVLCQFDDFAGMIYEDWNEEHHIVPSPFTGWTETELAGRVFWMSMDPGTQNPTAGLWCWVDQENRRLVGVAEYQQPGLAATQHATAWRMLEAQHKMRVRWRVADPNAITQRDRGTATPLQSQYQKLGFQFNLGASSEDDRITSLAQLITTRRFVVTKDCPLTFEAIKGYQWEDLTPAQRSKGEDPKERPLKKNTHLVECGQYLASRMLPGVSAKEMRRRTMTFQDEIHTSIRKSLALKHRKRRGSKQGVGFV